MNIIIAISAVYLIFIGALMSTKGFGSGLLFKVTPLLLGFALTMLSFKNFGLL